MPETLVLLLWFSAAEGADSICSVEVVPEFTATGVLPPKEAEEVVAAACVALFIAFGTELDASGETLICSMLAGLEDSAAEGLRIWELELAVTLFVAGPGPVAGPVAEPMAGPVVKY